MCYFNSHIHLLIDYDKATEGLLYGPTSRIWGTLLIGELYQLLWMDYLPQILFFEIASQFVHIVTNDVGSVVSVRNPFFWKPNNILIIYIESGSVKGPPIIFPP